MDKLVIVLMGEVVTNRTERHTHKKKGMNAKNDNQVIALKTNFKSIINSLVRLVMVVRMVVVGVRIILMMMMG